MQAWPPIDVAVVFERTAHPNRWEDWGFALRDVMLDEGRRGHDPVVLRDDGRFRQTLYPGLSAALHRDEAEGYHLNLTSGNPVWFVMWRIDDADRSRAWPELITLSYNEAARLLDAQERVDNVPLQPEIREWLQAFTDAHYRPEPKRRRRPASFRNPSER